MVGQVRRAARIDRDAVQPDALERKARQPRRGSRRQHREVFEIARLSPPSGPAAAQQDEVLAFDLGPEGARVLQLDHRPAQAGEIQRHARPREGGDGQPVERRRPLEDVRRRVHMRAGVRVERKELFGEPVLFDGARGGDDGRLGARVDRHAGGDRVAEVDDAEQVGKGV